MTNQEALELISTMPRHGDTVTFESQEAWSVYDAKLKEAQKLEPVAFERRWNEAHND